MIKQIVLIVIIFLIVAPLRVSFASEASIESSASLKPQHSQLEADKQIKKLVIKKILKERRSPLFSSANHFVETAYKYRLDAYLMPSIAWVESSLGINMRRLSHNPFGWAPGVAAWQSYNEGIEVVAHGLRNRYYDRGAKNIYDVGRVYAESRTWANRVDKFMALFYNEEEKLRQLRYFL